MNIIVCIDKNGGMMFNGQRQSQDSILREKVMELSAGAKLWMNSYSAGQFGGFSEIQVSDHFLEEAKMGDFCFVEDRQIPLQDIEKIYVFHWNRKYPADMFFEFDLKANGFKREKKLEFAGSSHDKILLEIYKFGGISQ